MTKRRNQPHKPNLKVYISSPCQVSWDTMEGDDCIRHCRKCKSAVYNLPLSKRGEIVEIVTTTEGRLPSCMYYRGDGKLMSTDCPVGKSALRERTAVVAAAFLALCPLTPPVSAQGDAFDQPSLRQGTKNSEPVLVTCGTIGPRSDDTTVIHGVNACSTKEPALSDRTRYFLEDLFQWLQGPIGKHPIFATIIVAAAGGLIATLVISFGRKKAAGSRTNRKE